MRVKKKKVSESEEKNKVSDRERREGKTSQSEKIRAQAKNRGVAKSIRITRSLPRSPYLIFDLDLFLDLR